MDQNTLDAKYSAGLVLPPNAYGDTRDMALRIDETVSELKAAAKEEKELPWASSAIYRGIARGAPAAI